MVDDRKARLAALASRAGRNQVISNNTSVDDPIDEQPNQSQNDMATNDEQEIKESLSQRELKFRNYTPKDVNLNKDLRESVGDQEEDEAENKRLTKRSKWNYNQIEDESNNQPPSSSKTQLQKALIQAKADAALSLQHEASGDKSMSSLQQPAVTSIAPKKVNWDLKRDIAKKLNKLEKRTQRAIVELLRERLEREAEEENNGDDNEDNDLD